MSKDMIKLTKRQKYIKEKYFEIKNSDPPYHCPIINKGLNLSPNSLMMIIDLIIDVLEKEYDGVINWVKIT